MTPYKKITSSAPETMALAKLFSSHLKAGDIVFLTGPLGAGKTTFTKGLAQGFKIKADQVNSPTFILMNYYEGRLPLYHFDFYRICRADELSTVDMDEYFYGKGITIIEWPERLGDLAPKEYFQVSLGHCGGEQRSVAISAFGQQYNEHLKKIVTVLRKC